MSIMLISKAFLVKKLFLQSWEKCLQQSEEIKQNWVALQNFNIFICVILDHK